MKQTTRLSTPPFGQIRILIVDDIPQVRHDLRLLLELSGEVEVVGEAGSGAEAIAKAGLLHPQVILMDLGMPGMDGFEATRQIKAKIPDCRVIAFSVHSYSEARQKPARLGRMGLLKKVPRSPKSFKGSSGFEFVVYFFTIFYRFM